MALEKINLTFEQAFKASIKTNQPFKLPEWDFTVKLDCFHFLLFENNENWKFLTEQATQRTDWQLVSTEFTADGPIEQKEVYIPDTQLLLVAISIGTMEYLKNNPLKIKMLPKRQNLLKHQFNILSLKEKFGFKYVSLYDGYVLNINKDWKIFFRNNEFQLNCVENKIGDVVHSKSLGLNIASIEDLEAAIKLLNLQPQ